MKHQENVRAALAAALSRLGLECSSLQQDKMLKHLDLLIQKNNDLNLTRITSLEDAVVLHIEDSLSVYEEFNHSRGLFCDIGTGGGFPGIPLGVVSERPGVLLDSVKKKAIAVQEFIDALRMNEQLKAVGMRSEELAVEQSGRFETVVARAVSSLAAVEELAAPLLRFKGRLVAMRGIESNDDEKMAQTASEKLGLELVSSRIFHIGSGMYQRSVYVYEKVAEPSVKLPRRPGMAQKRPYGS